MLSHGDHLDSLSSGGGWSNWKWSGSLVVNTTIQIKENPPETRRLLVILIVDITGPVLLIILDRYWFLWPTNTWREGNWSSASIAAQSEIWFRPASCRKIYRSTIKTLTTWYSVWVPISYMVYYCIEITWTKMDLNLDEFRIWDWKSVDNTPRRRQRNDAKGIRFLFSSCDWSELSSQPSGVG